MATLISQLFHTAKTTPAQTAIVFQDASISYLQLEDAVRRLANGLSSLEIQKGDRVAILLPNVPHFCISYYATLAIGAIAVPLNFLLDSEELVYQYNDCGAKCLITWQGFEKQALLLEKKASDLQKIIMLGNRIPRSMVPLTRLIADSAPLEQAVNADEQDIAVINYTSGIADEALGAELSHSAIAYNSATIAEMFRVSHNERFLAVLPLFHAFGQTFLMHTCFTTGSTMVLSPCFKAEVVLETIQNHGITVLSAVPGMFRAFLDLDGDTYSLTSLKYSICYGGHLPEDILREFEQKFDTKIYKAYGLTEAGPLVSIARSEHDRDASSVGFPLMGVEVQIRDDFGDVLAPNQSGEIYIKSPSQMTGYYGHVEETKSRLVDGWLASGDIGYLDINHHLFIQERKDDIIIKGGFQIHSREIEQILLDHPQVDEVAVVAVPDAMHGSEAKAFIVLKDESQVDAAELESYCQNVLPVYKCPKFIEVVARLPKSATGKVLKRNLRLICQS